MAQKVRDLMADILKHIDTLASRLEREAEGK